MVQTVFHNLLIEAESMSDVHNCGTARPRYTYQEPLKLQNVDKVTEEDRALMDVARDMWGRCNQERALSPFFNSFCYG